MSGVSPVFFTCLFAICARASAEFLRGSENLHELFHKNAHSTAILSGRHQASRLLAVTDNVEAEWKNQMHSAKEDDSDKCEGSRYMWMATMMKKCQSMFGSESYWDRDRMPFCKRGYQQCQPYYSQCCTQPEGAMSLSVYCDIRAAQNHLQDDPACVVQTQITKIQSAMARIPDVANRILLAQPRVRQSVVADPASIREESTESVVADESYHDAGSATPESPDTQAPPHVAVGGGPSSAPKKKALVQHGPRTQSKRSQLAATRTGAEARSVPEPQWERIFAAPSREVHCTELSHVLAEMNDALGQLTVWRATNTGSKYDPVSLANQDPELLRFVDNLVAAGGMLKHRADACTSTPGEEDEEDAEEIHFLSQSPVGADQGIVIGETFRSNEEGEVRRLTNRMNGYMGFIGYLNFHVSSIESKVHPHAGKWWRFRYEETLMEAILHIPLFVALICLQRFMSHLSQDIGAAMDSTLPSGRSSRVCTSNLYRHLNISCMHNSVAIAIIMFSIWLVNAKTMLLDRFAVKVRFMWETCNDITPDHCIFQSVPFTGDAYYTMWTSSAMVLLGACMLYSFCVWEFLRVSVKFLERLKVSEQSPTVRGLPSAEVDVQELEQYVAFQEFFCARLANMQASNRLKSSARAIGLDLDRILTHEDLRKVKFHRYLVVSLDHASHHCVVWSPALLLTLITWCLFLSFVASWKHLSFAWFLPSTLVTFFALLGVASLLKTLLWTSTIKDKTEGSMPWLSAKGWVTAVQIVLFMMCYTFARFMFSRSIWLEFPQLAFNVLAGFIALIILTRLCISELIMRMVCILSLPPNASTQVIEDTLEAMADVAVDAKSEY